MNRDSNPSGLALDAKEVTIVKPIDYSIPAEEDFREWYVPRYGYMKFNRAGTIVLGKSGKPFSLHWRNKDGYVVFRPSVVEDKKKKRINRLVHRYVAKAFVSNPYGYSEVNHIDGNKENNNADNLEWCTRQENVIHSYRTGLVAPGIRSGEKNGRHKLTQAQADEIRKLSAEGVSKYRLAKKYGVGWTTVQHVVLGDTWRR